MSADVTIPADVAKALALNLHAIARSGVDGVTAAERAVLDSLADLLDPRPVSLRDEVAAAWVDTGLGAGRRVGADTADAVLAVVKARIEAVPLGHDGRLARHDVLALFGDAR